jgi:hypothetical protein
MEASRRQESGKNADDRRPSYVDQEDAEREGAGERALMNEVIQTMTRHAAERAACCNE